jgi:galactofuranose transport system permease protein
MFPGAPAGDHSRVGVRERTPTVLSRTASRNGVTISTAFAMAAVPSGPPVIRSAIRSTARSAIAALSGSTVVNVGTVYAPSSLPSKPTTARSSGTRLPCSAAARSAPTASRSLKQNTASGGSGRVSSARIASAPSLRWYFAACATSSGTTGHPGGGEGGPVAPQSEGGRAAVLVRDAEGVALGGVLAAYGTQYGFVVGLLLPLAVCGVIGLVNGLLVARGGLPPFIVTLASLLFARGLLLALTSEGATTYTIDAPAFLALGRSAVLGVGTPVWIAVVLLALGGLALHRTWFGQTVFAVGGAENSALLMGLLVARAKIVVYTASGLLAGLAGVLTAAYLQSGVTVIGVGTELDAIAAVVIGGTLLTGGAGTVLGTAVGVLLRNVISNIINQVGGLDSNIQSVISGAFLLVVVVLQQVLSGRSVLRQRRR